MRTPFRVLSAADGPPAGLMLSHRNHDDHVETRGETVVWSAHGCVQKSFTLPTEAGGVIGATWCKFSRRSSSGGGGSAAGGGGGGGGGGDDRFFFCILQPELLTVYEPEGQVHAVPLPFRATDLWAACDGLVIDCQSSDPPGGGDGGAGAGAVRGDPLIFSLLHPLEEPCQLGFTNIVTQDATSDVRVLFVSDQFAAPLVITYNSQTRSLSAWVTWLHVEPAGGAMAIDEEEQQDPDSEEPAEVSLELIWTDQLLEGQSPPECLFLVKDWCVLELGRRTAVRTYHR